MKIIETDWKWRSTLSLRSATDYIALHHAAAVECSAAQVDSWHKGNGWAGIGYHFFVRKNGEIYRGRPLDMMGAHVEGKNNRSVGVCVEGDYDRETVMPVEQRSALRELLDYLKEKYPSAQLVGHGEIGASDCPGRYYPLEEMKRYYMEGDSMNEELERRIEKLENPMIYNYIDENMPSWAHEGVQWCLDNGIIHGNGEGLGLDDKDLKICTMLMRVAAVK